MTIPTQLITLAESEHYMAGHVFESGYVIDKGTGQEFFIGDSYGDPDFALIDKNEQWILMLGHSSYLWTVGRIINLTAELSLWSYFFKWPYQARQTSDVEIAILDDPWGDAPAIYSFNVLTNELSKTRDFDKITIPYTDNLDW